MFYDDNKSSDSEIVYLCLCASQLLHIQSNSRNLLALYPIVFTAIWSECVQTFVRSTPFLIRKHRMHTNTVISGRCLEFRATYLCTAMVQTTPIRLMIWRTGDDDDDIFGMPMLKGT